MFTGIVTDLGAVAALERPTAGERDTRLTLSTGYDVSGIALGASIACNGACLTVVDTAPGRFAVEASAETLHRTTLGAWKVGTPVNLERALRLGDELGGHIVTGHVDGVGEVLSIEPAGADSTRWEFQVERALGRGLAEKGSVAIDGVSLTVNHVADLEVDGRAVTRFGVNIIRHTRAVTNFGSLVPGSRVNVEIDTIARYVQRLLGDAAA